MHMATGSSVAGTRAANDGERRLLFGRSGIYSVAKSACLPQRRPENCASLETPVTGCYFSYL